jgi:L-aspartate oxidase
MKTKEILIIGAGIAGCSVALALAKRDIAVTIMTSPFDQRVYHAPFIHHDRLEEIVCDLQRERQEQLSCSRAYEQLVTLARQSIDELLEPNYLVDRHGNIDIHRCLQDQLKQHPKVEWLSHHSVIELLTLDQHSHKKADRYKKPGCLGVISYNHETQRVEYYLAKETILATGDASSLFPYSTHPSTACGGGIAIAYRAGARLLNMDQIQFHPLGLFEKDRPCFPLPLELLAEGGKIYASKTMPLEIDLSSPNYLLHQIYDQLLKSRSEHLWLDLTHLDHMALKEKFPTVDTYCLNHGFHPIKDPLPITPIAVYTCGGIAVDKTAQTTLQRLRAIGGVACTGLFWNSKEETLGVLESLTWALACAEDIAKQVNKFIYYFPDLREGPSHLGASTSIVEEDWKCLRQTMWSYVGIHHDRPHLERGCALLDQLALLNTPHDLASCSIEQIQLYYAIQAAQLIAHSIRALQKPVTPRFSSPFPRVAQGVS